MNPRRIAILGAGPAGLACAYTLGKRLPSANIDVFTKNIGGKLESVKLGQSIVEKGPHSIRTSGPNPLKLLAWLQSDFPHLLEDIKLPKPSTSKKRFIQFKDKILPLPSSFFESISFALQLKIIPPLLRSAFIHPFFPKFPSSTTNYDQVSLRDWSESILGPTFADHVVSSFIRGVYSGSATRLSLAGTFPAISEIASSSNSFIWASIFSKSTSHTAMPLQEEERHLLNIAQNSPNILPLTKSGLCSFEGGLGSLTNSIYKRTIEMQNGVKFHPNLDLDDILAHHSLTEYDEIISSLPISTLPTLCSHLGLNNMIDPKIGATNSPMNLLSVTSISFIYDSHEIHELLPPHLLGFGILTPEKSSSSSLVLGVIFDSAVFETPGQTVLTIMLGGGTQEAQKELKTLQNSEERLQSYALAGLERLTSLSTPPSSTITTHWNNAIPQRNLGYRSQVNEIQAQLLNTKLTLIGSAFADGIGVPDAILSGLRAAWATSS